MNLVLTLSAYRMVHKLIMRVSQLNDHILCDYYVEETNSEDNVIWDYSSKLKEDVPPYCTYTRFGTYSFLSRDVLNVQITGNLRFNNFAHRQVSVF